MINPILEFLEETYGFAPPAYIYAPITEARAWWSGMWGPFHLSLERHAGHAPYRREMYKMGMAKKSRGIIFSLPVSDVAGLAMPEAAGEKQQN